MVDILYPLVYLVVPYFMLAPVLSSTLGVASSFTSLDMNDSVTCGHTTEIL